MRIVGDGLGPAYMLWKRRRYIIVIVAFLGQATKELLRTNLSVAILPMTENYTAMDENGSTVYVQNFEWDVKSRGFLLSVYYYGYITTIMFGGILAVKYGGAKIFGLGTGVSALCTLLSPAAASLHFYMLIAVRIFQGMSQGVLLPSMEYVFARWIPLEERSSIVGFVSSGFIWGTLVGISLSGAVAHYWRWQAVFYTTGGLGVAWVLCWFITVKENPRLDKNISHSELMYIEKTLGNAITLNKAVKSVPYFKIMTSVPLWALILTIAPASFSYVAFATQLPAYMKDVLKQDIQISGYLTSLPFLANVLTMYGSSPLADFLINRNIFTNITVRKIYICGGLIATAIFSFIIQQTNSVPASVACLVIILMSTGSLYTQIAVNILDLAPSYSSVMCGLYISVSVLCSMVAPTVTAYLTPNKTAEEWNTVFTIIAAWCVISAGIYAVFGSGELQPWAAEAKEINSQSQEDEGDSVIVVNNM